MTKNEIKNIENKLRIYYKRENITKNLNFRITQLEEQIEELEHRIKNNKISIGEEDISISYSERVQGSGDKTSYAEKAFVREIENLEREKYRKKDLINKLEEKLRDINLDNEILDMNINMLNKEDRKFLNEKYNEDKPDWILGRDLNMSQSSVYRHRKYLLKNVQMWIEILE